jgi:hypothetical protein
MPESSPAVTRVDATRDNEGEWPAQAADTIVRVVGEVRDATTGKAILAARGVVYGLLAGLLGAALGVMIAIASVRLLVVYLPESVFGPTHVWAAHMITGLVFTIAGMVLWSKRKPAAQD